MNNLVIIIFYYFVDFSVSKINCNYIKVATCFIEPSFAFDILHIFLRFQNIHVHKAIVFVVSCCLSNIPNFIVLKVTFDIATNQKATIYKMPKHAWNLVGKPGRCLTHTVFDTSDSPILIKLLMKNKQKHDVI